MANDPILGAETVVGATHRDSSGTKRLRGARVEGRWRNIDERWLITRIESESAAEEYCHLATRDGAITVEGAIGAARDDPFLDEPRREAGVENGVVDIRKRRRSVYGLKAESASNERDHFPTGHRRVGAKGLGTAALAQPALDQCFDCGLPRQSIVVIKGATRRQRKKQSQRE
jgi:hypothetical protein